MLQFLSELNHQLSAEDDHLNLNYLPEEILTKIFQFLPIRDILNIALTSTRLAFIIDDNFNTIAPSHHKINLKCWNEYRDWIGIRKYSSFKIDSSAVPRFQQIISTNSHQITKLNLNFHNDPYTDMSVIRDMLIQCENLKELKLNLTNVTACNENSLKILPILKKLEILDFYGTSKFFQIFMNFQLKILKLRFFDSKDNFENFKKFLKNQTKLSELKLIGYNIPSARPRTIFDDAALEKVSFKLKKLKISRQPLFFVPSDCFQKFLSNHVESLEKLSVAYSEMTLDTIQHFKKLKTLKIEKSHALITNDNLNIVDVTIKKSSIGFIAHLPNLHKLKLNEALAYCSVLNFQGFRNLQYLDVYTARVPQMNIPSVKNLKICNAISFDVDSLPIFNNNIENLTIENCENIRSLVDFLNQPEMRLRSLMIENSKIESKCYEMIQKNREKIDILDIRGCSRVANSPVWDFCACQRGFGLIDPLRMGNY